MPKVYLDEIDAALNSTTFQTLETDVQESKSLEESLSSYIHSSHRKLKGDQWNKSRDKMQLYSDALKTRMEMAAKLGRKTRPDLHLGICGEHGGEPTSIEFCHKVGLDYVSCSPYRVPIARIAAAQANLANKK